MKRLTVQEIAACKALREHSADEDADFVFDDFAQQGKVPAQDVIDQVFEDWGAFADGATSALVRHGFMDVPSGFGYGHEKLLAFKLFTEAYERRMSLLIKARYKIFPSTISGKGCGEGPRGSVGCRPKEMVCAGRPGLRSLCQMGRTASCSRRGGGKIVYRPRTQYGLVLESPIGTDAG